MGIVKTERERWSTWRQDRKGDRDLARFTKCLGRRQNPFLQDLEKKLIADYEKIRDAEALFWKQKSRDKWLSEGDRNTKFFHLTTIVRRRRNKIDGLFDINGVWRTNLKDMQQVAVDFFKELFTADPVQDLIVIIPSLFPEILASDMERMNRPISENDIHSALFRIGKLKAPGVDGFPALFFQQHWNLCAAEITSTVTQAFSSGVIPSNLNHTLITLVPKIPSPQHMQFFRPISLCCTVYKVISKIIVDRIRPLLRKWISPNQVSFVPGRHISDNIMIAQELLHKCKNSKGKKGFMAWKIDLSKAYDKLSWKFIEQVLGEVKIPANFVKLIMSCISTASYQIIVNGELSQSFTGSRGIRQGDPLSPYLFVLCMEKLSHIIQSAVDMGYWKPFRASQSGPFVSHLFFADDLILFAEASASQANILKQVMNLFCSLSGQTVSFEKSRIFCSPNVKSSLANNISRICGSPLTEDLGVYLGMPLIHSRVSASTYTSLVDKVQSRLASWKSKTLNMAGRLTLIQSVTSSIPIYAMQTAKLPSSICEKLDKLNRDFLWGDSEQKRKIHLTNWDMVCRPKCFGGLGIKKSSDMNKAMLAKVSWRIIQEDKGLWNEIYQQKYLKADSILQKNYDKPTNCSSTWSAIVSGAELLRKGVQWRIGNGCTAKFWVDSWSPCGILENVALDHEIIDLHAYVCDFWTGNSWNLDLLFSHLPIDVVHIIASIPISDGNLQDRLIWGNSSSGVFSVKSAYQLLCDEQGFQNYMWRKNWSMNIPPKLKIFLWSFVSSKILTNEQRHHRKLSPSPSCKHCAGVPETMLHLFRDCPKASIFVDNFQYPFNLADVIIDYATEWHKAIVRPKLRVMTHVESFSWIKPAMGFFKLNVDGSRTRNGDIGAAGVIRDEYGCWKGGFMACIGAGEVLQAEAWGLYYGIQLALNLQIAEIEVESDSAVLINLVQNADVDLHPLGTIVLNCRSMLQDFKSAQIKHIHRERNVVADILAKNSTCNSHGIVYFTEAPACVAEALVDDMMGVTRDRSFRTSGAS
ncbi:hypothetical protein ACLB2K_019714 [Fragaria x ananassa]